MMLKITAKGQVTFRKDVLDHLGARPGDKLDVDFLPNGAVSVRSRGHEKHPIDGLFGMFGPTNERSLTIEDINEAIAAGWAGEVEY